MEAKYDGRCPACQGDIIGGVTKIVNDDGQWVCEECAGPSERDTTFDHAEALKSHATRLEIVDTIKALDGKVAGDKVSADDAFALLAAYDANHDERAQTGEPHRKRGTPHKDLRGDRYGRYTLISPAGKPTVVSRASTVIKALADTYDLNMWKQSRVLLGAASRPDLSILASSLNEADHRDKAKLKALVREAEEAGGSKRSANLGTAVHAMCEAIDTGAPGSLTVPRAHRADVAAYVAALYKAGVSVIPDMVERTTMTTGWGGVGGTFDRIYRLHDGRYVIGDLKTGKVGYDPAEMYGQFAVYQDGVQENGVYDRKDANGVYPGTWTRPDFDVDRDEALIVHLPVGQGKCVLHSADLSLGRLHLDRCARIRAERKERHTLRAYAPAPDPDTALDEATRLRWAHALEMSATKDVASLVWMIMTRLDLIDDDVTALASEVAERLSQDG